MSQPFHAFSWRNCFECNGSWVQIRAIEIDDHPHMAVAWLAVCRPLASHASPFRPPSLAAWRDALFQQRTSFSLGGPSWGMRNKLKKCAFTFVSFSASFDLGLSYQGTIIEESTLTGASCSADEKRFFFLLTSPSACRSGHVDGTACARNGLAEAGQVQFIQPRTSNPYSGLQDLQLGRPG